MRMLARNVLAAVSLPLMTATAAVLLLLGVSAGRAQITNFEPGMLAKQRSALYTKATRAPLADLESDVNHLAVLSESCRAEYGAKTCALPDKPLRSDKLEERYAYYIKGPIDARWDTRQVKISRQNWDLSSARWVRGSHEHGRQLLPPVPEPPCVRDELKRLRNDADARRAFYDDLRGTVERVRAGARDQDSPGNDLRPRQGSTFHEAPAQSSEPRSSEPPKRQPANADKP